MDWIDRSLRIFEDEEGREFWGYYGDDGCPVFVKLVEWDGDYEEADDE